MDFKAFYQKEIVNQLHKNLNLRSKMQVPKLKKIILNTTSKEFVSTPKLLEEAVKELAAITGQKPVLTKTKKSLAAFKLRENQPIGCKVTLRNKNMYNFLEKLIKISLPRVRDFNGVSVNGFDGSGSFAFGIKEQIIFPEIEFDKIQKIYGLDVIIVTSAKDNQQTYALLKAFNFPFASGKIKEAKKGKVN